MLAVIDVKPGVAKEVHLLNAITLNSGVRNDDKMKYKPTRTIYAQVAKSTETVLKLFSAKLHKGFYAWTTHHWHTQKIHCRPLWRRYLCGDNFKCISNRFKESVTSLENKIVT